MLVFLHRQPLARALGPPLKDRFRADVGLEATGGSTSAAASTDDNARMAPLTGAERGAAIEPAIVEQRGADARTE